MDEVKELQQGYGGWASYMVKVSAIITQWICGGVWCVQRWLINATVCVTVPGRSRNRGGQAGTRCRSGARWPEEVAHNNNIYRYDIINRVLYLHELCVDIIMNASMSSILERDSKEWATLCLFRVSKTLTCTVMCKHLEEGYPRCRVRYNPRSLVKTGEKPYTARELKGLLNDDSSDSDDDALQPLKAKFKRYTFQSLISLMGHWVAHWINSSHGTGWLVAAMQKTHVTIALSHQAPGCCISTKIQPRDSWSFPKKSFTIWIFADLRYDVVVIPDHISLEAFESIQKERGSWNPKMKLVRHVYWWNFLHVFAGRLQTCTHKQAFLSSFSASQVANSQYFLTTFGAIFRSVVVQGYQRHGEPSQTRRHCLCRVHLWRRVRKHINPNLRTLLVYVICRACSLS